MNLYRYYSPSISFEKGIVYVLCLSDKLIIIKMGVGGFYHHASYIKFQSTLLLVQGNAREIILRSYSICLVKKGYILIDTISSFKYHIDIGFIRCLFLNILLSYDINKSRFELTWYKVFYNSSSFFFTS